MKPIWCAVLLLGWGLPSGLAQETVLWSFAGAPNDGAIPLGNLVVDSTGNLFGTTCGGGSFADSGVVFELSPTSSGSWTETILHDFTNSDGACPEAGLTFDAKGDLYGTTSNAGGGEATGTVFRLARSSETWQYSYFSFDTIQRGYRSTAGVTFDSSGHLYGTTSFGGLAHCNSDNGCGTAFELTSGREVVLHRFTLGNDGGIPQSGLTLDPAGDLFGTTEAGGKAGACTSVGLGGCGVVFEITLMPGGTWKGHVIWTFSGGQDGAFPEYGNLVLDALGNLYGTTAGGGFQGGPCAKLLGCGVVFELTASTTGGWAQTVLYTFTGGMDGGKPTAGLVFDAAGNLYGTTSGGGSGSCQGSGIPGCGVVFELSPTPSGWAQTVLYSFTGGNDGGEPIAGVTLGKNGNLYGTTQIGGSYNSGVVFEIMP